MALLSDYTSGTITVAANGTAVTGSGTAWLTAGFQEGDLLFASGFVGVVQSVDSNTALTLAQPWKGGALNGAAYRLRYQGDGSRVSAQARQLIDLLGGSGNLQALGALVGAADKLPFFTGAGTMNLTDLKSVARAFLAANFAPVQQGGGTGQFDNKLRMGWDGISAILAQVDTVLLGRIWADYGAPVSKASPGYQKLPNGLLIQWWKQTVGSGDLSITFPVAFSAPALYVGGQVVDVPYTPNTVYSLWLNTIGATSFNAYGRYGGSGGFGPGGVGANFLAIGSA